MELSTQAVDKILEALAPSLSAELDRVLQEARGQQEEEFLKRLEAAVHEAENAVLLLADAEKEKALAAERERISAELQAEKERAIADAYERAAEDLRSQLQETLRQTTEKLEADFAVQAQASLDEWDVEKSHLEEQVSLWRTYAEAQQQLAESGSQAEMLTRFLNLAEPFAAAVAVYVAKADGLALWKARGKGAFPELVSQDTIDPESFFKPLVIRDRTVAAVCAVQPYTEEPIEFLSSCLGRAVEALGMKLQTPAPRPRSAPAAMAVPAADEKLAAEARLAARILVSEIKIYNEQDVYDGRSAFDLYLRLQKQIDQGREQYRQRLGGRAVSRDYYHEELVRVLADGETYRLGAHYPGPRTT